MEPVADVVTVAQKYFRVGNNFWKTKHYVVSVEMDHVSVKKKSPLEQVTEKMLQQL